MARTAARPEARPRSRASTRPSLGGAWADRRPRVPLGRPRGHRDRPLHLGDRAVDRRAARHSRRRRPPRHRHGRRDRGRRSTAASSASTWRGSSPSPGSSSSSSPPACSLYGVGDLQEAGVLPGRERLAFDVCARDPADQLVRHPAAGPRQLHPAPTWLQSSSGSPISPSSSRSSSARHGAPGDDDRPPSTTTATRPPPRVRASPFQHWSTRMIARPLAPRRRRESPSPPSP